MARLSAHPGVVFRIDWPSRAGGALHDSLTDAADHFIRLYRVTLECRHLGLDGGLDGVVATLVNGADRRGAHCFTAADRSLMWCAALVAAGSRVGSRTPPPTPPSPSASFSFVYDGDARARGQTRALILSTAVYKAIRRRCSR
uniref:Uncharacterized protein n=1 Tax=Plectus sambesii TaxID=2011161 RepID=A0A914WYV9_9BILA